MATPRESRGALLRGVRVVIFVTVGAQMPFDRLIRAVDGWAYSRARSDVFAQIGSSIYQPKSIGFVQSMDPLEFRKRVETANIVVAHAGMGSIITALEYGKQIIVMPRRGDLKETRNDHQVATARTFLETGRIIVAFDEQQLVEKLDQFESISHSVERIEPQASLRLINTIRDFIENKSFDLEPHGGDTERAIKN